MLILPLVISFLFSFLHLLCMCLLGLFPDRPPLPASSFLYLSPSTVQLATVVVTCEPTGNEVLNIRLG